MRSTVYFMGGNGHSRSRLDPARDAIARLAASRTIRPFEIAEAEYPGFENRARAADFESFLAAMVPPASPTLVYATGIGGLLALCLRSKHQFHGTPLILQAPVLWGLEKRWMPRVMRLLPTDSFRRIARWEWFRRRFARTRFTAPLTEQMRNSFFDGFAQCVGGGDLFSWLTPRLLRSLEADFAAKPEMLNDITVWWGERDRVLSLQELRWTEAALGRKLPLRLFASWGHYPMIDDSENWVRNVADALATSQ